MPKFLPFDSKADALARSRELMDEKRKPGNPDGDGKPYKTIYRGKTRTAEDGTAVLELADDSQLTPEEKLAAVDVLPSKFDPPEPKEPN